MCTVLLFLFLSVRLAVVVSDPTKHANWGALEHEQCGQSAADRIIGGQNASLGAYPWIARIGYVTASSDSVTFRCGSVLLNKNTILTAAHCVHGLPNGMKVGVVRLGEHNTETDPDCDDGYCADSARDYKPSEVIVHNKYGDPAFKNDISIIRLTEEVTYTNYIKPICMMYGDLFTKDWIGATTEVAGWGIWDIEDPKASVILQTVKLDVVDNENCKTAFAKYAEIGNTQMCVGGKVGKDSCGGDSGGPLMKVDVVDGPPRYFLLGVVSFGAKKCGASTMPGVYTKLTSYMDWILDNLKTSTTAFENVRI